MALLLIEGFDHMDSIDRVYEKGWFLGGTSIPWTTIENPRYGLGKSLFINERTNPGYYNSEGWLRKDFSSATTVIVGLGLMTSSGVPLADNTDSIQILTATGTKIAALRFDSSHHPYIVGPTSITEFADPPQTGFVASASPFQAAPNVWHYYEIKIVINGSSGSATMNIDGVQKIAPTTYNFGSTAAGSLSFYAYDNGISVNRGYYVDDIYVLDNTGSGPNNTFLGDCVVETIVPIGAGTTTNWTANTGDNWAAVDELSGTYPDGATTYIASSTPGDVDTYNCKDIQIASGVIFGVQVNLYARKDDAALRQIAVVRRQGATNYVGTDKTLSTSYEFHSQLFPFDPTGATWTVANINADEFGVKETN